MILCAAAVRHGCPSQPHPQQLCVCGAAGSRVAVGDTPAGSGDQEGAAGAAAGPAASLTAAAHAGEPPSPPAAQHRPTGTDKVDKVQVNKTKCVSAAVSGRGCIWTACWPPSARRAARKLCRRLWARQRPTWRTSNSGVHADANANANAN